VLHKIKVGGWKNETRRRGRHLSGESVYRRHQEAAKRRKKKREVGAMPNRPTTQWYSRSLNVRATDLAEGVRGRNRNKGKE
jgi:hypothetical protein